jgi:hypothetical protein
MRFKTFLTLNENFSEPTPKEIAALIFRDCKPFLEKIDFAGRGAEYYVYRGLRTGVDVFAKLNVRKDRKPKDMPPEFHEALNDYLVKKFGIPYRSESIFVTSRRNDAASYGDVCYVFPIGDFTFIWDKIIDDPWIDLVDRNRWLGNYEVKDFVTYLEAHDSYQDTDFIGAAISENEIMIACDSYYAINTYQLASRKMEFFMAEVTQELIRLYNS